MNQSMCEFIGQHPHPGDDPIARLRHVNKVYAGSEAEAVTATRNLYGREEWTGLTYADLRAVEAEIDRLNQAWLSARAGERLALALLAELGGGS